MFEFRRATSATIMFGPFLSNSGTGLATLTVSPQLVRLSKNGGAFAAKNLVASNAVHGENAYYSTILDDTDTGSLGRLLLACSIDAALAVWHEYTVIPTSEYDARILGTVVPKVDVVQVGGSPPNALVSGRFDASVGAMANVVVTSAAFAVSGIQQISNMLATDMSSISATVAARSPINAMRILRNRVTTSGFVTVYAENDSTAVWTGTITTNASGDPIVEMDPSG
mgnify:CR=1 FL=1